MPTYEYACRSCGEHLEVVQSFREEPLTTCPACEGPLRKVFGTIGIAFKGKGFYSNDSRSKSGAGSARAKDDIKAEGTKSDGAAAKSEGTAAGAAGNGAKGDSKKETAGSAGKAAAKSSTGSSDSKAAASS